MYRMYSARNWGQLKDLCDRLLGHLDLISSWTYNAYTGDVMWDIFLYRKIENKGYQ